jgi:hypothetical protein
MDKYRSLFLKILSKNNGIKCGYEGYKELQMIINKTSVSVTLTDGYKYFNFKEYNNFYDAAIDFKNRAKSFK